MIKALIYKFCSLLAFQSIYSIFFHLCLISFILFSIIYLLLKNKPIITFNNMKIKNFYFTGFLCILYICLFFILILILIIRYLSLFLISDLALLVKNIISLFENISQAKRILIILFLFIFVLLWILIFICLRAHLRFHSQKMYIYIYGLGLTKPSQWTKNFAENFTSSLYSYEQLIGFVIIKLQKVRSFLFDNKSFMYFFFLNSI